jgi:hypothetical protein
VKRLRSWADAPTGVGSAVEVALEHEPLAPLAGVLAANTPLAEDSPSLELLHAPIVPWVKMAA